VIGRHHCRRALVWVLAECYGADRARIRAAIEGLLAAKQIARTVTFDRAAAKRPGFELL